MQAPAVVNVSWPEGALPVSVLVTIIVVSGALIGYALVKLSVIGAAKFFKDYATDFPSQKATVLVCLCALIFWVLLAASRMALGMEYPTGYGDIALLIGGGLGFGAAAGVGKHAFSAERETAKGEAAAKIAAATPPPPVQMNVAGDAPVQNAPQPVAKPAAPQAAERDPRLPSATDDERTD